MTVIGYNQKGALTLKGLSGFHREAVDYFRQQCETCCAKRATKKAKRPAMTAIRVSKPFSLCQVWMHANFRGPPSPPSLAEQPT